MDVGVIGVGVMGKNHARVYSEMKAVSSLYLYDINTGAVENVARAIGAHPCQSVSELLKNVDAVSICVPTQFHYDTVNQVIRKGVSFLVEKPICMNYREGEDLLGSIPEDVVAGVGHIERFNPVVTEIKRIMKKPLYIEAKRHNPTSSRITGSSVVEDLMIHDIDIIFNLLFPYPVKIQGAGNADISSALFSFNGMTGYLSASRKSSKKIRSIYIEEEDCTIEGNFMSQEVYIHRKPHHYSQENERYLQENIIEKVMVNKVEPLRVELAKFLECAKAGREFPVTVEQAVYNLRICDRIKSGFKKEKSTSSSNHARSKKSPVLAPAGIPPAQANTVNCRTMIPPAS